MSTQFFVKCGARYRAATPSEVCEGASAYVFASVATRRPSLSNPSDAREFIRTQAGLDHEQFGVVFLDARHRVIAVEILSRGTIDGASVYPREIVKRALEHNAAATMVFHNHPSGNPNPSNADEAITRRLKDALALIDVRLLDHLIAAGPYVISMAERGML